MKETEINVNPVILEEDIEDILTDNNIEPTKENKEKLIRKVEEYFKEKIYEQWGNIADDFAPSINEERTD